MPKKVKIIVNEAGHPVEKEIEVPDDADLSWGDAMSLKVLGTHIQRLDGPDKVTGRAKYTYDINLPGMLYGRILRSPFAHAQIRNIDTAQALKLPGVKAVLVLNDKTVHYAGDEVAAVAAVSPEIAWDAIRAIRVDYQRLPHVVEEEKAKEPGAPQVHGNRPNVNPRDPRQQGDVEAAFKEADGVVEATYYVPVRTHCCLETHGAVARWDDDQHLTVWCTTQGIFSVRDELARFFNLPESNVRVICHYMGGGFGSKFGAGVEGIVCARLAREAKAPVKLMLTREEEHLCAGNAPSAMMKIRAAAKKDGTLVAFDMEGSGTGGLGGAGVPMPYIYRAQNVRVRHADVYINAAAARAFRAPGHPQASAGMEQLMDELAEKIGMDPLEFRKVNDPNPVRHKEYDIGAERIGWERRNKVPGSGPGPIKRGLGMGSSVWGGGGGPGTQVTLKINRDGSVEVGTGSQDLGTGTRTFIGAIVAEELGLPIGAIKVNIGDTSLGYSGGSGGSTTTASVAPAVKAAATDARHKFLATLASAMNVKAEDLDLKDGKVSLKSDPTRSMEWKQACARLGMDGVSSHGEWVSSLQQSGVAGCQFAEVEVDIRTGRVRVVKVVAVHDCGLPLNRLAIESQINGGVIMGIGMALTEERIMDNNTGRMVNPNLEEYKLPGPMEIPQIEPVIFDNPTGKVSGIGEPPIIPTAGAIANAVYNAIGVRIRELPITPKKVLEALAKKGGVA